MSNCTKCGKDISHIEVVERVAKSGKNVGKPYKARICTCGTFNFENSGSTFTPTVDNKEIVSKLDEILRILKEQFITSETVNQDGVERPQDVQWEE